VRQRLLPVEVDEKVQVGQPVLAHEHHGFPGRSFVQLSVADEREDVPARTALACGKRSPRRDRQTLAERAGAEIDARNSLSGWTPSKVSSPQYVASSLSGNQPRSESGSVER